MLIAAAQNGSDFCKRRKLPSLSSKFSYTESTGKNHLAGKNMDISPTLYQKLTKIIIGAQKAFQKNKMSILTDSGDRRSEWSAWVFEDLYVNFDFYALIKVSVNVLDIGVFTACNTFIYLCPKRKLKGSKNTGSGTIFQTDFGDNGGCRLRIES